jgi:hypothetical protein
MKFLVVATYEDAATFNERAFAQVQQAARSKGAGWSDIFVDTTQPNRFAVLYTPEIAPAFSVQELAKVEEAERVGNGGNWEAVPPPVEEEPTP